MLAKYSEDLNRPTLTGFAVRVLLQEQDDWTEAQVRELVDKRRTELGRPNRQEVPDRFDAALLLYAAYRAWDPEQPEPALALVSEAVETLPGDATMLAIEREVIAGQFAEFSLGAFVTQTGAFGVTGSSDEVDSVDAVDVPEVAPTELGQTELANSVSTLDPAVDAATEPEVSSTGPDTAAAAAAETDSTATALEAPAATVPEVAGSVVPEAEAQNESLGRAVDPDLPANPADRG